MERLGARGFGGGHAMPEAIEAIPIHCPRAGAESGPAKSALDTISIWDGGGGPAAAIAQLLHFPVRGTQVSARNLWKKMKKELSILGGNPQSREEIAHTNPEMFIMLIHRCGMVHVDLWLGPLAGGK